MAQDARVKRAHVCIVGTREFNFGFLFSPLFLYYTLNYTYTFIIYIYTYTFIICIYRYTFNIYIYAKTTCLCFGNHHGKCGLYAAMMLLVGGLQGCGVQCGDRKVQPAMPWDDDDASKRLMLLVNIQITMEKHHVEWVNPLKSPFLMANSTISMAIF